MIRIENCIALALDGLVREVEFGGLMKKLKVCAEGAVSAERLEKDLFGKEVRLLR